MSTEANGKPHTLAEIQERVQFKEAELRLARLEAAASTYQRRQRVNESFDGEWYRLGSYASLGSETFSGHYVNDPSYYPVSSRSNRSHGSNWPVFRDETTLGRFREASRSLTAANSYAKGLLRNLTNYSIGHGYRYTANTKEQQPGSAVAKDAQAQPADLQEIVAQLQDFLDTFCRTNRWNDETDYTTGVLVGTRERELYRRVQRDGEAFVRLHYLDDGRTLTRFIEPEQITDPPGATQADGWSYGIRHQAKPFEDVETVEAYFVAWLDPTRQQDTGEEVPASEVVHVKHPDTDSTIKRGVPAFSFDTYDSLARAGKTQRNISAGAAVRAATAEYWEHANVTQTQVSEFAELQAAYTQTNPVTGRSENIEHIAPGTVRRGPEGQRLVPKPAQTGVAEDLQAVQGDLRQASTAFSAPEYMTGDASNANYASTLVAGAPFVIGTEAEQAYFKVAFLTVLWRAVRHAVSKGVLDRRTLSLCQIEVEAPAVVQVDKLAQAQADQIRLMMKTKAPQQVMQEDGLDPEATMKQIAEFEERFQPQGMPLPMPDDGMGMPAPGDLAPRPGGGLGESIQEAGGTCKQGETAKATGCTPSSGGGSGGGSEKKDSDKQSDEHDPVKATHAGMARAQAHAQKKRDAAAKSAASPSADSAGDAATRNTPTSPEARKKLLDRAKEKVKGALAKGKEVVVDAVVNHQHVAPVIEAYRNADTGVRGKAVRDAVVKEAGKKLGKVVTEKVTGVSKDLWDEVSTKHGKIAATIAQGAYIALNKTSLIAETATGVRFIPGLGSGLATARQYACYYGVRAATDGVMAGVNLLRGKKESLEAAEPELTPEAILAALREYDQQLSEFAGVEPGDWDDAEVMSVVAEILGESMEEAVEECDGELCDKPGCPAHGQPLLEDAPTLNVPDSRQSEGWSCGAACVTSVCQFFGVEPDTEGEAIRALGSSPSDGTDPEHIVAVLTVAGLETTALSGMDLDQLEYFLGKGRPVIACVQAWGTPDERAAVESGHYVVCCGIDAEAVTVMDPARFEPGEAQGEYQEQATGQKVRIPRDVFLRRWVDVDAEGNTYQRYGVAVWQPGVTEAAGTCKQGETAKATGCVPASKDPKADSEGGQEKESPDRGERTQDDTKAPEKEKSTSKDEKDKKSDGATKDKKEKDGKEEWDGTIDQDAVEPERHRGDYVAGYNVVTDGENYDQSVMVRSGTYETPNGETVDVYRWEAWDDGSGDRHDQGEWTKDYDEASRDGRRYARDNDEDKYKPDKEEKEEDNYNRVDPNDIEEPDEPSPPKKAKTPETKLGKSKAKVEAAPTVDKAALDKMSGDLFGEEGVEGVASLVGAPDDAVVKVIHAGDYKKKYSDDIDMPGAKGVRVEISHPKMDRVSRFIGVDGEGKKFIKNEILEIKPQFQGEGLGMDVFARQVENASASGFDYISTHAAGGPGEKMNGYYTWPRFGYDESVKSIARYNNPLAAKILEEYPDARSVREIMATEEGRAWWKSNGGDLYNARFDVREGSWSRYILDEYVAKKREKRSA